eukprot:2697114-Prymnesium_polylepis.1
MLPGKYPRVQPTRDGVSTVSSFTMRREQHVAGAAGLVCELATRPTLREFVALSVLDGGPS